MDVVSEVLTAYGLPISIKKSEVMLVQPRSKVGVEQLREPVIYVEGKRLAVVTSFKYVGSTQNCLANTLDETKIRAQKMAAAYHTYRTLLFENKRIRQSVRLRAFNTFVMSSAVYCCEAWNSTQAEITKLEAVQFRYLRRMLGYHWSDRKSFADIIDECRRVGVDMLPVGAVVIRNRLTYFGHVNRMANNRLPKMLLYGQCADGKKSSGGQEIGIRRVFISDMKSFGIDVDFNVWFNGSLDRAKWRNAVKTKGIAFLCLTGIKIGLKLQMLDMLRLLRIHVFHFWRLKFHMCLIMMF
jgi:hypothetical protein